MRNAVLVTGANGQLGTALRALSEDGGQYTFTFIDRSDVELTDAQAVRRYFEGKTFDAIVNCAAYTAVDGAEREPAAADAVNRGAVETLAHIAKEKGIALIHLSTDYVFDGRSFMPYREDDPADPQCVYGRTKRDGEAAMLAINPANSLIIRTSWVYSEFGNNFVKTMLRLGAERARIDVVYDQVGAPTYAGDLAAVVITLLPRLRHGGTEVYHYANAGVCSWYDFAKAIFELSGTACEVRAIETKAYPTPATRPHYSLLNTAKIKVRFGLEIPYWRDSLMVCLDRLKEKA